MKLGPNTPAFPQHGWSDNPEVVARMSQCGGMTYRQWLAGVIAAGLCSDYRWLKEATDAVETLQKSSCEMTAEAAVNMADALIAALNKGEA